MHRRHIDKAKSDAHSRHRIYSSVNPGFRGGVKRYYTYFEILKYDRQTDTYYYIPVLLFIHVSTTSVQ